MAYRSHEAQPQDRCCLGNFCWRKFCPWRNHMRRWAMERALAADRAAALEGHAPGNAGVGRDIPELDDDDREG